MTRYAPVIRRAWLGWRDDGEFRPTPAMLMDIGLGGCRVGTAEPPPTGRSMLMRLDGTLLPAWYEVDVLDVRERTEGGYLVRLQFPDGCPYPLYMAAAFGHVSHQGAGRQPALARFFAQTEPRRRARWR